ncbi:MAG: hypothetical protein LBI13_10400 [Streptococcaceae bacterium]|jgi:hypothetical protein|nr:hypothetical protein [Streptococcaceae bacterium]
MEIFTAGQAQEMVDAILLGYEAYIQERLQKAVAMEVSDGYAWTKGNHIDDAVAKANLGFIESYKKDRAGESWGYLKFISQSKELGRVLLLIKNASRLRKTFNPNGSSQYLVELSEISSNFVSDLKLKNKMDIEGEIQLDLFSQADVPNLSEVKSEFDEFFVVLYETDQSKQIISISVNVLDVLDKQIIQVQDLSDFIQSSSVSRTLLENPQEISEPNEISPQSFPYMIPEQEEKEAN